MILRKFVIVCFLLLVGVPSALSQAVDYFKGSTVYQALDQAQASNKLLLVEFSAQWNYKSRWMSDMMNRSKEVSEKLNQDFIVFKIETNTTHGSSLAQTYSVNDYPYILVFDRTGQVIARTMKTMEDREFLDFLESCEQSLSADARWKMSQLSKAAESLQWDTVDEVFLSITLAYLDEIFSEEFWVIFSDRNVNRYESAVFEFFHENIEKFKGSIDTTTTLELHYQICKDRMMEYLISDRAYDSLSVKNLYQKAISQDYKKPLFESLDQMILNKYCGDIDNYLLAYTISHGMLPEEEGFKLAISLDFISESGSKEQKKVAQRMLTEQIANTKIGSQREMLMNIRSKF